MGSIQKIQDIKHKIARENRERERERAQSRHEEEESGQQPLTRKITATSESTCPTNTTIYDDDDTDYEIAKVAVIATNENIAYGNPAREHCQTETNTNKDHVYTQIRL
jgi:hypothetical protein